MGLEVRSGKLEAGSWKMEVRSWKLEVGSWRSEEVIAAKFSVKPVKTGEILQIGGWLTGNGVFEGNNRTITEG